MASVIRVLVGIPLAHPLMMYMYYTSTVHCTMVKVYNIYDCTQTPPFLRYYSGRHYLEYVVIKDGKPPTPGTASPTVAGILNMLLFTPNSADLPL